MEHRFCALTVFAVILLASGCTGAGDEEPQGSITVERFSAAPSQLSASGNAFTTIYLQAENTGSSEAEVSIGQRGRGVLRNYCPDFFEITEFDARTSGTSETKEEYVVAKDSRLTTEWRFELRDGIASRLQDYSCDFDTLLRFNYSVSTFQQIQVKPSEDVENSPLESGSTSGPMNLFIDTVPGTQGTEQPSRYVDGSDDAVTAVFRLQGRQSDGTTGAVDIDESSFSASASAPLGTSTGTTDIGPEDCSNYPDGSRDLTLNQGESVDIRCRLDIKSIEKSRTPRISASVDYTYLKDPGETTVRVSSTG